MFLNPNNQYIRNCRDNEITEEYIGKYISLILTLDKKYKLTLNVFLFYLF